MALTPGVLVVDALMCLVLRSSLPVYGLLTIRLIDEFHVLLVSVVSVAVLVVISHTVSCVDPSSYSVVLV